MLITTAAQADQTAPEGLSPLSVTTFLSRAAPAAANDIRINGIYGSGHGGAWQIAGHLTWRTSDGNIDGGTVLLPQQAGQLAAASDFPQRRLEDEHARGWSLEQLHEALSDFHNPSAPLALLELEVLPHDSGSLVMCAGERAGTATCRDYRDGELSPQRSAELIDLPHAGPLAVVIRG